MLKLLLDYKVIGFFIEKILLRFNKADSQVILKKLKEQYSDFQSKVKFRRQTLIT